MNKTLRLGIMSLIIAFMLVFIPLPSWANPFRPDWVSLVLIYWAIAAPKYVGVICAWCAGLLLDVGSGSLLGQQTLGLILIVYVVHKQHLRLRTTSILQQAIIIFFLLCIKQLFTLWVDGMVGRAPHTWLYFLPTLTSTLIWPWVYLVLREFHRKSTPHQSYRFN